MYKLLKIIYLVFWEMRTVVFTFVARVMANKTGPGLKVRGFSKVTNKTNLGTNVHLNGLKVYGNGNLIIGDNFHSGKDLLIYTSTHNYKDGDALPYDATFIDEDVTIEENVWIGVRSIILPGVTIKEGAIIGAGSVIAKDVERYAIVTGNPATILGHRDKIRYEKLKMENKFY